MTKSSSTSENSVGGGHPIAGFIKIAFQANNGKYVTSNSSGNVLQATSSAIGSKENFEMVHIQDKTVALKTASNKYVSNQQDGAAPLAAVSDSIDSAEKFEVHNWDEDKVALFASNQKYIQLTSSNSSLQALGNDIAAVDTFNIVLLNDQGQPIPKPTVDPDPHTKYIHPTSSKPSLQPLENEIAAVGTVNIVPLEEKPQPIPEPPVDPNPQTGTSVQVNTNSSNVFTVCFAGTACTRDEGEVTRSESDKEIYSPKTGYIPIRIHKEITGDLRATTASVTIRGVGENDWAEPRHDSEPLVFNAPLHADPTLLYYVKSYSGGDQYSRVTQLNGWSAPALALHAANLAAASGKSQYNFIGHSRGAVEAIMAAWFLYAYGPDDVKNKPVNIFAIDPVPGTGEWYGILTQLPPNVVNYVGIYAWDMCIQTPPPADKPFMALVPRPNGLMTNKDNHVKLKNSWWWPWNKWKYIADHAQLTDPLQPGHDPQPNGYELYACRGRHSTVAGNYTSDSLYDPAKVSETVAPVPELIYKMARGYLTKWGTTFATASAAHQEVLNLRRNINTFHREFDVMGGGETRTSEITLRPYVRRLSSIYGSNPANSYYMDNVVGDPPYKMAYPVTSERTQAGWVKWKFL